MSAFNPERIHSILTEAVKLLSGFQIELFTTVILTGAAIFVHKLKSMQFPFEKVSVRFLYHNYFGRLFLTEEGATIWNLFFNPYKSRLNQKHSIVLQANQVCEKPDAGGRKANGQTDSVEDDAQLQLLKHDYVNSVPLAKLYKGLLLQGYCVSPKFLLQLENFEVRESDVFVVSYPRSGTTWTEELLSSIYSQDNLDAVKNKPIHFRVIHLEVGRLFGQEEWLNGLPSPRLLATHLPYSHVPKQLQQLKCKVIYVARNPKDQAVSYYHYHRTAKYLGGKKWNFSDFLKLYENGQLVYGSWFDHVLPWYELSLKHPDKIMFLTYEQLNQVGFSSPFLVLTFVTKTKTLPSSLLLRTCWAPFRSLPNFCKSRLANKC